MKTFSERYGYIVKPFIFEDVSQALLNRIWNAYQRKICADIIDTCSNHLGQIMDHFGLLYEDSHSFGDTMISYNLEAFRKWLFSADWYYVYDFIDVYLSCLNADELKKESALFNKILMEENAGYRVSKGRVMPITDENEIGAIEKAQSSPYDVVNSHIRKATLLFSKRPKPDYENTVKEAISAVEAMCCVITEMTGRNATLGNAIDKLQEKGVYIHQFMIDGYKALYKYSSNEDGVRHGGIEPGNVTFSDAKYMLVSCSAFVNYLIEKWEKVQKGSAEKKQ